MGRVHVAFAVEIIIYIFEYKDASKNREGKKKNCVRQLEAQHPTQAGLKRAA